MDANASATAHRSASGAEKHAGLEGTTNLECCDTSMPVMSLWKCLDAFLSCSLDTPLLLLLAHLRCPNCQRMVPTFNIITTLSSVDFRKLQQRISIAAQDALEIWPKGSITPLLKEGLKQLTDEPWVNMRPLFEKLSLEQLQEFVALHQEPQCNDHTSGNSGGSILQYQSEQKRVKPNDDLTTDEKYTRTALMAKISSCRRCRDTVKQASWSVATSATLAEIRRLLRREVNKDELFERALLLGGAVPGDSSNGANGAGSSATGRSGGATTGSGNPTYYGAPDTGDDDLESKFPSAPSSNRRAKGGFVKGTGYAGDAKQDAKIVRCAKAQQEQINAASASIMLHAVNLLQAVVKACLKRDEIIPTFMAGPHAVLVEGGLAHCMHFMLTHQPLDSLVNNPKLLEAQLKLLNAVMLTVPLQATILMPAGEPPVAAPQHSTRAAAYGYAASGPSVSDTLQGLLRSSEVLQGHAMDCNEVNEDGLHVGIDEVLNLTLFITSTASRLEENLEDVDELVDLPVAPDHMHSCPTEDPSATNDASHPSAQAQAVHERSLRRIGIVYAPLQQNHAFRLEAESMDITSASAKTRIRDVTKAVTALNGQLPIAWGSSVHVAIDEDRPDMFRVLVLPDQETPYANGAYVFDFLLPKDFPNSPPKAKFLTTGGGSVRFNPNLYQCGKVCLSLLGTWQGPSWDPSTSTILQVLVSLQAMVFCRDPYFNEPGYERSCGTSSGDERSAKYNAAIIFNSLKYAIRAPLERPLAPPHGPFREILALHWKHKRETILSQVRAARDDVIKHHGAAAARAYVGTRFMGGDIEAPSENARGTAVDSLIDDIRNLLDSFEDRYQREVEKEKAQKLAEEASARAKREGEEKERMFEQMQKELATHATS